MATDELGERLFTASTTAREAGAMALKAFRERPAGDLLVFKGPQDYLTETDGEVERLIRARITKNFWRDFFSARKAVVSSGVTSGSSIRSTGPPISRAAFHIFAFRLPSSGICGWKSE